MTFEDMRGYWPERTDDTMTAGVNPSTISYLSRSDERVVSEKESQTEAAGIPREVGKNVAAGVTDYLNKVSKYVVSSTMRDPRWKHTIRAEGGNQR